MTRNEEGFGKLVEQTRRQGANQSVRPDPGRAELPIEDAPDEADSYSFVSSQRQQKLMLELRFKSRNARALAYSYLVGIHFDPSAGIQMDFSGYEVRLTGKNLNPLFAGLVAQRVAVVTERDELQAEATLPGDATVVTQIEVKETR